MEISVSDNQVIENEVIEEQPLDGDINLENDMEVLPDEDVSGELQEDLTDVFESDGFETVSDNDILQDFGTFGLENEFNLSDESLEVLSSIDNNVLELKEAVVSLNTPIMHKWFYSYNTEQGLLLCIFVLLVVIILQNFLGKRR